MWQRSYWISEHIQNLNCLWCDIKAFQLSTHFTYLSSSYIPCVKYDFNLHLVFALIFSAFNFRRKQDEVAILEDTIRQRSEQQRKAGVELEATCHICLKTKFADGVGHICNYCNIRCCARCGGKVTIRAKVNMNGFLTYICRNSFATHRIYFRGKTEITWWHGNHNWKCIYKKKYCFVLFSRFSVFDDVFYVCACIGHLGMYIMPQETRTFIKDWSMDK